MTTRAAIVAAARSHLGTPYRHQGRAPGVGLDCLGLLIVVGRAQGFVPDAFDRQDYTHQPRPDVLHAGLREHLVEIQPRDAQPGDILVMATHGQPVHVGIRTDVGVIHAYGPAGAVVEHGLRAAFARAVRYAFSVPGVADG